MADANQTPHPQQAIPPKVVPPSAPRPPEAAPADAQTVRRQVVVNPVEPLPSAAPRTVRLRPIAVPGAPVAAPVIPPASPSAAPNAVDAAIKRMTSQIAPLPPLERSAAPKAATVPVPAGAVPSMKKSTSRIPLPTSPMPLSFESPKTIKIQPLAGVMTAQATAPIPAAAPGAMAQQASKSKTSRIPLEAAMGVPPSGEAGAPKTIKLRRPGEMAAVKVAAPAGGAPSGTADANTITQRKTIRVKRPTLVSTAEPAASAAGAAEEGTAPLSAPVLMAPAPAPRLTGLFVAIAAVGVVIGVGLLLVFSSQLFGPNASLTELSTWAGINIPLPGKIPVGG